MTIAEPVTVGSPVSRPHSPARDRLPHRFLWVALAIGVALRAPLYLANPSLLLDEARVALNVASRGFLELAQRLDYDQTAPVLFLWLAKAATLIGGVNEYAMRALPFAAGVAMLPLTYLVVRRVMGSWAAVFATALAAVSPLYLQYVRQVKPYTTDGAVTLLLLWLALDWLDTPGSKTAWRRVMVFAAVAVWLSTPSVLVVAGMLAAMWFARPAERPPRARQALTGLTLVVSFIPAYVWLHQPVSSSAYMQEFWGGSLLTIWEPGLAARSWQAIREFIWQIFGGGSTEPPLKPGDRLAIDGVVIAALLLGTVGMLRTARLAGWTRPLVLLAPLVGAVAASVVGGYPIAGRIMLFAAPTVVASVAGGVVALAEALPARRRALAGGIACAALLGLSLPLDLTLAFHPLAFEHLRPAVAELERRSRFEEPVYVFTAALPAWTFYTTDWRAPDRDRLTRMVRLGSAGGPGFENAAPRVRPLTPADSIGLSFPFRRSTEMIGVFTGAQWRSGVGNVQFHPDTNWTVLESARIAAAGEAAGAVWVIFIRTLGLERQLFAAMRMCVDDVYRERGVLFARFVPRERYAKVCRFDPFPPDPDRLPSAGEPDGTGSPEGQERGG
jgi:4-amino-4-deoxy-L-arabinose transferase-like glycosyltransferase